ncbi:hypothetical protein BYT27DRAFT_7081820, partial [Phlegmacium glaucopus]
STMSIRPFNPFLLQSISQKGFHIEIQEVIYYAESRFWCILNEISNGPIDRQGWMQKLLHCELLFTLSYVGISVAVGHPIDIPIILRSLADSIGLLHENALLLSFDANFLATLDIGAHEKDHKSQVVSDYEHCWWSGQKPRNLDTVKILDAPSLESSPMTHAGAGDNVSPHAGTNPDGPCQKCDQYRDLLSQVLQDLVRFQNVSASMSMASQNKWKLGIRRASTFHLLHEAALCKETAGSPTPVIWYEFNLSPALAPTAHYIAAVAKNAKSELNRLMDLPASSYKWTWGETLTEADVLALCRTGTRPGPGPHSGYDVSLVEGRMFGDYTVDPPTVPTSHGQHDDVPAEASLAPPTTDLAIPTYFSRANWLSYDPLGGAASSLARYMSDDTHINTPAPLVLQSLARRTADMWTSGSDSEIRHAPAPAVAHRLADIWSDGEGSAPAQALQLAEVWTDEEISGTQGLKQRVNTYFHRSFVVILIT